MGFFMKKVFLVSVRYTLLSPSFVPKTFLRLESVGYDRFKQEMLQPSRLDFRLKLFCDFALPSLQKFNHEAINDSSGEVVFKVLINASSLLPVQHKEKLLEIEKDNDFLEVIFSPEENANIRQLTLKKMKKLHGDSDDDTLFLTMRMDDDDALSNDFYEKLNKYARKEFSGFGVSFPNGYIGYLDDGGGLIGFRNYNKPKIAIGLCYIKFMKKIQKKGFKSIYCFGSHGMLDRKAPVIIDSSFKSYVRTAHIASDVYGDRVRYEEEVSKISGEINAEEISSSFSFFY